MNMKLSHWLGLCFVASMIVHLIGGRHGIGAPFGLVIVCNITAGIFVGLVRDRIGGAGQAAH